MSGSARHDSREPIVPHVPFERCPIRASLGVFGRKWALLVLRDVAFFRAMSFGQILHRNPGMTPRVLSMRLRDLQKEGVIERIEDPNDKRSVRYHLTTKGDDVVPILTAFIQYGIRHHADLVFQDGKPRTLEDVFPEHRAEMLGRLARYAENLDEGARPPEETGVP